MPDRDYPEGYPGPPPGADPDGRWTGGGKWRPFKWVPNTPPPPEDPPEPDEPRPPREPVDPSYDWMGNETTRPAPGGFESWDAYNKWRANLGGYRARPGARSESKWDNGGRPRGRSRRPAGADRIFGRDPSEIQDQLARDRTRGRITPGPVADPVPRQGMPFPAPPVLPVGPPPPEFQPQPMPVQQDPRQIAYLQALMQAVQPQPMVQPVNPLQVLMARLGIGGF